MTTLPSQATLAGLGIDTLERAIVLSAMLLKSSLINQANPAPADNALGNSVQFAFTQTALKCGAATISAKIPLNITTLLNNFNLVDNLFIFSTFTNILTNILPSAPTVVFQGSPTNLPLNIGLFNIPALPTDVLTLEQYFVWASLLWQSSIANVAESVAASAWTSGGGGGGGSASLGTTPKPPDWVYNQSAIITVNINEITYNNVTIILTLPFEWYVWTNGGNLIEAIINVGTLAP